jgi:hypothetical protein
MLLLLLLLIMLLTWLMLLLKGRHFINPIMLSLVNKYVGALLVVGMAAKSTLMVVIFEFDG